MKTKALVCVAAAGLASLAMTSLLAADFKEQQALFAKSFSAHLCPDLAKCTVMVRVEAACKFTVTPWTLGLPRDHKNVKIHWMIDPASYGKPEFDKEKGISFKPGSGSEFSDPKRVSATEFRWNDKNEPGAQRGRPHNYVIKVVQDGKPCTLDPTIVNDF